MSSGGCGCGGCGGGYRTRGKKARYRNAYKFESQVKVQNLYVIKYIWYVYIQTVYIKTELQGDGGMYTDGMGVCRRDVHTEWVLVRFRGRSWVVVVCVFVGAVCPFVWALGVRS